MKKLFEFLIQMKQNRENLCQSNVKQFIQFLRNKKSNFFNLAFFILVFLINHEFRICYTTY